ncbi:mitochondrial transcription factor 1 [Ceratocystis lukuohia]|uniref:rRNA adenine N(6)-methyltransferase n=1 Tax=Ceratocystis lukuohia TaxID=2019550 RepID=A0ABR4M9X7_9PEZI
MSRVLTSRNMATGRPTQKLATHHVRITNEISKWLYESGLYRVTSSKASTKKPPPKVEKNRVHIINEEFVDQIITYLGDSLDRHKGCDLLDINPGVGIWSKALHKVLEPRKHIMMEPDGDFYAEHLKPLTDKPNVEIVHKHGVIWDDVYSTLDMLPEQKPVPRTGPVERNDTLLITMNLGTYPKKKYQSYESVSALILHQIMTSVRTRSMFQKYGLVRMLVWTNDEEKRAYIPKNIFSRRRAAIDTEAALEYIHEVVGSDDMSSETRANLIQLRQPTRLMALQLESGRVVAEKMKKAGRVYPKDRQSDITKQLEKNTPEERRKDQEYIDRIISGLIKRREYITEYEKQYPKPEPADMQENDPTNYFLAGDLVKFRSKFFMTLPDNETGLVSKKPQLYGISKPRDAPRRLIDNEEVEALKRLAEVEGTDEMDEDENEEEDIEKEIEQEEEEEEGEGEEEVKPKKRSRSKKIVEAKEDPEEEAKSKRRSRSKKAAEAEEDAEEEAKPKRRSRSKKAVEAEEDAEEEAKPKRRSRSKKATEVEEDAGEEAKPKRRSRSKKAAEVAEQEEVEAKPAKRRGRKKKAALEAEETGEEEEPKPKRCSHSKNAVEISKETESNSDGSKPEKPKRGRPTRAAVLAKEQERDELLQKLQEEAAKAQVVTKPQPQPQEEQGVQAAEVLDRSALTVPRSTRYMPAPPSPTAIVKQIFGPNYKGTVRDIREWLARAYNQMWVELREKYRSGEYTMEQYMEGHKLLNDEINLSHINYIATTRLHVDEHHCFNQDEPVLLWDRREYEPLITKPHDVFPDVPMTLLDIQPKSMHPLLRDNVNQACLVFDVLTMAMINSSGEMGKLLDKMWPGAADGCLPNMPEAVNLKRYGIPIEVKGTAITTMTGRRMNQEQYYEMLEAWQKWPFRPTYAQLICHHTEEPPNVPDQE